eukprot:1160057-Pelagomonas_calceolata.AAC.4
MPQAPRQALLKDAELRVQWVVHTGSLAVHIQALRLEGAQALRESSARKAGRAWRGCSFQEQRIGLSIQWIVHIEALGLEGTQALRKSSPKEAGWIRIVCPFEQQCSGSSGSCTSRPSAWKVPRHCASRQEKYVRGLSVEAVVHLASAANSRQLIMLREEPLALQAFSTGAYPNAHLKSSTYPTVNSSV